jgi:hypothetical protein
MDLGSNKSRQIINPSRRPAYIVPHIARILFKMKNELRMFNFLASSIFVARVIILEYYIGDQCRIRVWVNGTVNKD